ncbi:hypothetical protein L7F22_039834 [Adiantum nelumboides]|nr:hypothetical protein [Adiantum nelumboides]
MDGDCDEYVPLSPSCSPHGTHNLTYNAMLQDALAITPNALKKEPILRSHDLDHSQVFQDPTQLQAPEMSPSGMHNTSFGEDKEIPKKTTKGTMRQRASAMQRDDKSTHTLLWVYEESWIHIKKRNFRAKD